MRITAQQLSQSDISNGKRYVVVEGVDPVNVNLFLSSSCILVQNSEEDYDGYFTSEGSLLNVVKPDLFVCNNPSESDVDLCRTFNCDIVSMEKLSELYNTKQVPTSTQINNVLDDEYLENKNFEEGLIYTLEDNVRLDEETF